MLNFSPLYHQSVVDSGGTSNGGGTIDFLVKYMENSERKCSYLEVNVVVSRWLWTYTVVVLSRKT